jgi:hypothetical protein
MADLHGITEETLEQVQKAQTQGFTTATGVTGYDLGDVVSLVPVNTPFYDRVARKEAPQGSQAAHWKALLNINNQQPSPFTGLDGGGSQILNQEQDVLAQYLPIRVSGQVTQDEIDLSRNYADAKALAVTSTLMQWRIQEDKALIGGQAFPLPQVGTVTLVSAASASGTIPTTTSVYVAVAARSPLNYFWGGSGKASATANVSTTAGNSTVTATVPAVRGAVAYDWFVGASASSLFYAGTTTVNTLTINAVPTAAAPVPPLPDLYAVAPSNVPPATDTSAGVNSTNGLLATLSGDYGANGLVTAGTGTGSGATFQSLDGNPLTSNGQGVKEIDALLLAIYNQAQLSPTALLVNGGTAQKIAQIITENGAAVTYLQSPEAQARTGLTGGVSAARYINGASGGDSVDIVVDPHLPSGLVVALTEQIPYPNSGIANTFEARTLRDVSEFDYGVPLTVGANGGPRQVWDVSSIETFVNRAPVACGVLTNIAV